MAMNDLVVLANTLSRFGLRGVHVMSMRGPVDAEAVRAQYVTAESEEVMRCAYVEKELGAHHLVLSWPAREVVTLKGAEGVNPDGLAVMWWIGERSMLEEGAKATVREAVDLAGTLFTLRVKRAALRALVRKLPNIPADARSARGTITVCGMELVAADWVPAGFVVVA